MRRHINKDHVLAVGWVMVRGALPYAVGMGLAWGARALLVGGLGLDAPTVDGAMLGLGLVCLLWLWVCRG